MLTPMLFFNTVNAYQRTAAIQAAVELDVFTAIAEGQETPLALATRCHASERGMRILADHLVILGFLTKSDDAYQLTPESALFLDRRSPAYVGGTLEFLLSPLITNGFQQLTAAVKKGGSAVTELGTLAPEHPVWVQFARAMAPMMRPAAQQMAQLADPEANSPFKVLDIAASHGLFGLAFAQQNPQATIVALDWPNVLQIALENAEKEGVSDRYHAIPGSAFEADFGTDYDVILLPNFLHHFNRESCEQLLRKVHAALATTGKVVTLEFIPNEDRISPPDPASFSLVMLASTPEGEAYTFAEYEQIFSAAGFSQSELFSLSGVPQKVIVSVR